MCRSYEFSLIGSCSEFSCPAQSPKLVLPGVTTRKSRDVVHRRRWHRHPCSNCSARDAQLRVVPALPLTLTANPHVGVEAHRPRSEPQGPNLNPADVEP